MKDQRLSERALAKRGDIKVSKRAPEKSKAMARRKELSPLSLIAEAVREHLPMETIERLAALHEKALAAQAKNEFFDALTELQAELPQIIKTKKVLNRKDKREEYGDVRFTYAPIEVIVENVKDLLKKHGFSYTFKPARSKVEGEERWLEVPCILHHVGGHEETSVFPSPIMSADERRVLGMSQAQAVNAAQTFGRRCSFIAAIGIMTADPDNDGANTGTDGEEKTVERIKEPQAIAGVKTDAQGKVLPESEPRPIQEIKKDLQNTYELMQQVLDGNGHLMMDPQGGPRTKLPKDDLPGGPFVRLFPDDKLTEFAKAVTGELDTTKLESILTEWRVALQNRYADIGFEIAGGFPFRSIDRKE